jgi:hypothetical protein
MGLLVLLLRPPSAPSCFDPQDMGLEPDGDRAPPGAMARQRGGHGQAAVDWTLARARTRFWWIAVWLLLQPLRLVRVAGPARSA